MIAFRDLRPVASLCRELERGLEEIHEQPHRPIQARQYRRRLQTLKASIADCPPDHGPVLLLDPRLVVLSIGTAARELDPRGEAVISHGIVHEHAVVVRVQSEEGEGQQLAHFAQHLGQQSLFAHQQRRAFRPAGGDVGQH